MKHTLFALAVLVGTTGMLHAQVFIPTQLERDWLNELIPGVVTGDGIMDTLHPGIALVDTAALLTQLEGIITIELHGIQHLDSLNYFVFDASGSFNIQLAQLVIIGVPSAIRTVNIYVDGPASITLPDMPPRMDNLSLRGGYQDGYARILSVGQMPDSLNSFVLSGFDSLSWGGSPYSSIFALTGGVQGGYTIDYGSITTPMYTCDNMQIDATTCNGDLDLRSISARQVSFSSTAVMGTLFLPSGLDIVWFDGDLAALGELPSTLRVLNLSSAIDLCLPRLPDSIEQMQLNGIACLPNLPPLLLPELCQCPLDDNSESIILCSVLNSDCPGGNPGIAGRLFIDLDEDGIYDSGEPPLPQASVTLAPGGIGAGCNQQGHWEIGVLPGTYTITPSTNYPYAQAYSPALHTGNVPNMGDVDTLNDFAATLVPNIQDLQAWLYADPARPGFDNRLFLNCRNYGTMPVNATLTLQWDGDQQWVGSSVTPTILSGNTATWALGTMAIAAEMQFTVDLSTLATVPLDTPIEHVLSAGPLAGDETPDDNVSAFSDVVVGSYDPNDKLLNPAAMSPAQLQDPAARIDYTIRFQNTGTYLAERVVILDTLPEGLILESIQFLASSHPNNWYLTGGVLHVIHNDIMLPDSTSDEPNSHGFIRFSIKPDPSLTNGTTINNIAHIIFDFNEPIITPPAVFTVDVLASVNDVQRGTINLWPNPTRDVLRLTSREGALSNEPCVVRDLTGRAVLTTNTDAGGGVNVTMLAKGAYTVQVNGQNAVLRFVKE